MIDADGDEEGDAFIVWTRGTKNIGYENTYTVTEADNNQELTVELAVEAKTGWPRNGEYIFLTIQIDQWNAPTVSNVLVSTTGEITVGTDITASYDYADVNVDLEEGSIYEWRRDGQRISGETELTYTLQNGDAGKYIQFYVTPQTTTGSLLTGTTGSDGLRIGNIQTCEYSSVDDTLDCIETEYDTTTIGNQVWMAENLNFTPSGSSGSTCYSNTISNCTALGRLYYWETAMESSAASVTNPSNVKGICPAGWHIPSEAEFQELFDYVNDNNDTEHVSTSLKSTDLWSDRAGSDSFGFNGYPAGGKEYNGDYWAQTSLVGWWATTLAEDTRFVKAWYLTSQYDSFKPIEGVNGTSTAANRSISVRCVKDAQ